MAQNRTWTLTETGQTRSWTLTQSSESKTFSVTPSTATRNFTVSPGVGPTGPNEVSTSTSTDITGILKGDGSTVSAAVADTDYQSVPAEGAFADGDKTKLDGIETAATADQTAAEILTAIKTVDGTGSGLDADTVDGKEAAAFAELATSNDFTATNTFSGGLTVFGVDGTTAGQLRLNSTTLGGGTAITPTGTAFRSISTPDSSGTLALTAQSDGTIQSSDLDFANSTDIGADLADADEVLVSDGGGNTTRRKSALSRFWTYIKAKIESVTLSTLDISGDVTVGGEVDITPYSTNDSQLKVGSAEVQSYSLNLGWVGENLYFDGAKFAYRSTGAAGMLVFYGNEGQLRFAPSGTAGTDTSLTDSAQFKVHEDGSVALGGSMNGQVGQYANAALLVDSSSNVTMSGDLTVDTDTLHVDSGTSQVGINISNTTPRADLHIGGGDFGYTYGDAAMAIGFLQTDDYSHFIHTGHNAGSGAANHIDFYTSDGTQNGVFPTNAIHGLTIENGKVGIGELTPATALQISGTQSFVANSGTWDGSTIAGDQTMSGQLELTGQSATGDDSAMTRSLGDLRWANNPDVHLLGNMYLSDQTTLLFRGTNTGSGSTPQDCSIMTASTGTTTGSTAHFRHSGSNTLIFGKNGSNALGWNFDSKWIFDFRAYINSAATNTDGYLVLGLAVSDTATTQPAAKSCGFRFHDQGLYAFVHNGSSYSESSSSLLTLSATNTPKAYSIHNDDTDIHFYLDGVLVDSITAPTGSTGNNKQGVAFWVDNETTTNDVSLNILGGFRFSNLA
jgi:hypothetical protein